MKKIFFLLIMINFISYSFAADQDQAYQNYLQRCAQASSFVAEHLHINDLAKIVHDYNCISYEQWHKNNVDLINAAKYGVLEKVKKLLEESELDINAKDRFGYTALMQAAAYGHKEMVELLINANADVNVRDNSRHTALIWASHRGHKKIVELLLGARADVNAKDVDGWTALKCAESNGHNEIVELLKKTKTNPSCCVIF